MSLANEYRPETLKELFGNATMKSSLISKLTLPPKKRPHSYMLIGQKGCGKTTVARIIASMLDCCDAEFYEIDASDESGGVAACRELKRTINYQPMSGEVRVWFIDECHKLTKPAQEALLKMLEEPPEHAYFILATTDPQKLLGTFKDRCTTYEMKPLDDEEMMALLDGIIESEEKEVPQDVLESIITSANGMPRQAIKTLERVIDLPKKKMLEASEQIMETEAQTIDLCRVLLQKKPTWKDVTKILSVLQAEPESVRYAVLGYCNSILLKGDNPRAYAVMCCFTENYYSTGRGGLTMSCYDAVNGGT